MSKLTPMMEQYFKIKRDYEDHILFYQLGDFYEMFGKDAILASKLLGLTITSCNKKDDFYRIPMCGFSVHAVNTYLPQLVRGGKTVAVCDQVRNEDSGILEHIVVRTITPGITLTVTGQISPTIANVSDPKFTDLPFVADIGKGKKKHRSYWQVRPNGNHYDERLIGKAYAIEALQYMVTTGFKSLLEFVVMDMPKGKKRSGIEDGFLTEIANFGINGARAQ